MKRVLGFPVSVLFCVVFTACAGANFGGGTGVASSKATGSEPAGSVRQPAGEDASGEIEQDCDEDSRAALDQPTVPEFLDLLEGDPDFAAVIAKKDRCYISHGGGHGLDVCLAGDKAEIEKLWPIEVRGNQLCVPAETLKEKAELFAEGEMGRCGR